MAKYRHGDLVNVRGQQVTVDSWPDNDEGMFQWKVPEGYGTDHVSAVDHEKSLRQLPGTLGGDDGAGNPDDEQALELAKVAKFSE